MMYPKIIISLCLIILVIGCNDSKNGQNQQSAVHFALNDKVLEKPAELLFYQNKYHLFYECSTNEKGGNWGHSQSTDLIHWENPQSANHPDSIASIGQGSIIVDLNNTCGLGNGKPLMVTICPSESKNELNQDQKFQVLTFLYSTDEGSNWNKYTEKAIVLGNVHTQINDIKIFWHEESQKWILLVLSGYQVQFYSSDNLIDWEFLSVFGNEIRVKSGVWTAIDFFPIEVEGTKEMKWALLISSDIDSPNDGSGIQYVIGDFDGLAFKASIFKLRWLDNGSDNYAGVVFSEYIGSHQQTYFIGSIYNSIYNKFKINEKKSGAFTLARQLVLKKRFDGYCIFSQPVKALETIEKGKQLIKATKFSGELKIKNSKRLPLEINVKFDVNNRLYTGMAEVFGIRLTNGKGEDLVVGYHSERRYFFIADPTISQKYPDSWNGFHYAPYVIFRTCNGLQNNC